MIHRRERVGLAALVRELRESERRHRILARRLERAVRDLARDQHDPAYVVEHAVAHSEYLAEHATRLALRDAYSRRKRT